MGLEFQKDLLMASEEIIPANEKKATVSKLQERLLKKLGTSAFPFTLELPKSSPPSVTLRPKNETEGKPCGVEYSLRVFIGDSQDEKPHKRNSVTLGLRIIQFAPSKNGRQPCTVVRRDFVLSPGELELEMSLDKQVFHHGESIPVNMTILNKSNKTVKKISATIQQCIDVCLFDHGTYKTTVASLETTEGCPLAPGSSFSKTFTVTPSIQSASPDRRGLALDGRMKDEKCDLASTTLMVNPDERDSFGIIVTYAVKVKLFLGALAGELVGELPFIFMHPKPNPRKLEHNDSVNVEAFRQDTEDFGSQDNP
ncbi:arrestin homolog isoform X2 [Artemia franciscana]